jgi:hypothetical protein
VPDHGLGKKLKCPQCANIFTPTEQPTPAPVKPLPAGAAPAEDVLEEVTADEPAAGARRRREPEEQVAEPNWGMVRLGVIFMLAALAGVVGAMLLEGITLLFYREFVQVALSTEYQDTGGIATGMRLTPTLLKLAVTLIVLSRVVSIAGNICCLLVPNRHGALLLAIASLVLLVPSLLAFLVGGLSVKVATTTTTYVATSAFWGHGIGWLSSIGTLLGVAQVIVFVLYVRALALMLREKQLGQQALFLGLLGIACLLAHCGGLCVSLPGLLAAQAVKQPPGYLGLLETGFTGAGALLVLATLAWYAWILLQTNHAIKDYLD